MNDNTLIKIAERHGAVTCWFKESVTITLTPEELRNIIKEALNVTNK